RSRRKRSCGRCSTPAPIASSCGPPMSRRKPRWARSSSKWPRRCFKAKGRNMSARDLIFGSIRRSLGVSGKEATRSKAVTDRLAQHPAGIVPARGQLPAQERLALFRAMVEAANGSVEEIAEKAEVPSAIAALLRRHNLPKAVRRGADERLAAL